MTNAIDIIMKARNIALQSEELQRKCRRQSNQVVQLSLFDTFPLRAFAYLNPESYPESGKSLNFMLLELFNDLESKKKTFKTNGPDIDMWLYNAAVNSLGDGAKLKDINSTLIMLARTCKIPEEHVYLDKISQGESVERQIYLSRHGLHLLMDKLLETSKSFNADLSTQDREDADQLFLNEMKFVFAKYYFLSPEADYNEIIKSTWNYVRGILLKTKYKSTEKQLREIINKSLHYKKDSYIQVEQFFKDMIEGLFGLTTVLDNSGMKIQEPFLKFYELTLEKELGYKKDKDSNTWVKKDDYDGKTLTAAKIPNSLLSSHVLFILVRSIELFFKIVENAEKLFGRLTFQELTQLAIEHFSKERIVLENFGLLDAPTLLTDRHYDKCERELRQIEPTSKSGQGVSTFLSQTRQSYRPLVTAFAFGKRKSLEKRLFELHVKYKDRSSNDLLAQICEVEALISDINKEIYGYDFQGYVGNYDKLMDGEFVPRETYAPNPDYKSFYRPDVKPSLSSLFNLCYSKHCLPLYYKTNGGGFMPALSDGKFAEYECLNDHISAQPTKRANRRPNESEYHYSLATKDNCRRKRILFEFDKISIPEQENIMNRLIADGILWRAVFSGGKSIHLIVELEDEPENDAEYRWVWEYIAKKYGIYDDMVDPSTKNNNRHTRRPGVIRKDTGQLQRLYYYGPDNGSNYSFKEDWRAEYEKEKKQKTSGRNQKNRNLINTGEINWETLYETSFEPTEIVILGTFFQYLVDEKQPITPENYHIGCASLAKFFRFPASGVKYISKIEEVFQDAPEQQEQCKRLLLRAKQNGTMFGDFELYVTSVFTDLQRETERYKQHIADLYRFWLNEKTLNG